MDRPVRQDRPRKPTPQGKPKETTIGVTDFKARCLELIDDVATGRLDRVVLTKRGEAVAEINAPALASVPQSEVPAPWSHMKGEIWIDPTWDPTEPFVGKSA